LTHVRALVTQHVWLGIVEVQLVQRQLRQELETVAVATKIATVRRSD
jgi:hypothetical protein